MPQFYIALDKSIHQIQLNSVKDAIISSEEQLGLSAHVSKSEVGINMDLILALDLSSWLLLNGYAAVPLPDT